MTIISGWKKHFHDTFFKVYLREDEHMSGIDLYSPLHLSWSYKISVFFGLPADLEENEKTLTIKRILKNFIGWPSGEQKYLRMPFVIVWNILKVFTLTVWQPVRFLTEFLPLLIDLYLVQKYKDELDRQSRIRFLSKSSKILLNFHSFLAYLFFAIWIVGLATTSPIDSIKEMYKRGLRIFDTVSMPYRFYIAIAFGCFSVLLSTAIYTACFPFAIQAVLAHFPVAATNMAILVTTHFPGLVEGASVISSATTIFSALEAFCAVSLGFCLLGNIALRTFYYCMNRRSYLPTKSDVTTGNGSTSSSDSTVVLREKELTPEDLAASADLIADTSGAKQEKLNTPGLSIYPSVKDETTTEAPPKENIRSRSYSYP